MSRIEQVSKNQAQEGVSEIYNGIERKLGMLPNMIQLMGNSPAVLQGYLSLSDALSHTSLDPKLREKIALAVGQINHCNYCLSAHSLVAKKSGIPDQEILIARQGDSADPKQQAILLFVKKAVEQKGNISDQDVSSLKTAGVNDKEIAEIVLAIVVNLFTNYFNLITDPKIDYPLAPNLK